MEDYEDAINRIATGLEKKNRVFNPKEKEIVVYHETGHALLAVPSPHGQGSQNFHYTTRYRSIGIYPTVTDRGDCYLMTRKDLVGEIDVLLGGRIAGFLKFGDI